MYKIIGANNTEYGPISGDQIRQWIAEGRVNAQTSAQAVGETGWKPISSFPEFAASFPSTIHAAPTGAGAPPNAPIPPLGGVSPVGDRQMAESAVSGPAIGLIVSGVLGVLLNIFFIIAQVFGFAAHMFDNLPNQNPELVRMMQTSGGAMAILFGVLRIALSGLTIYGGIKMKSLQQYGLAMTAAILAVIPCCVLGPCCCISLPLGIWALVILCKPEVKSHFG
jgi:hypothetical protein